MACTAVVDRDARGYRGACGGKVPRTAGSVDICRCTPAAGRSGSCLQQAVRGPAAAILRCLLAQTPLHMAAKQSPASQIADARIGWQHCRVLVFLKCACLRRWCRIALARIALAHRALTGCSRSGCDKSGMQYSPFHSFVTTYMYTHSKCWLADTGRGNRTGPMGVLGGRDRLTSRSTS